MKEKPANTIHPLVQLVVVIAITFGCIVAGAIVGCIFVFPIYGLDILKHISTFDTKYPGVVNSIWIFQITSTTIPLFVGPYIFAKITVNDTAEYLKPRINISPLFFVIGFLIMLFSLPAMAWFVEMNQHMRFPHWAQGVYNWMKEHEDEAQKETTALLQMKTIGAMLFDLLVIGLLTAIAEEFLFRGVIQTIFIRWTKNVHWGIWITAILFSAFHVEFFGFIPRLLLGVFFGYFVAYSGSIWTGVWGHFLNNGSQVVLTYLFQTKVIKTDPDTAHFNYVLIALSVISTLFLFTVYRNIAQSKKIVQV